MPNMNLARPGLLTPVGEHTAHREQKHLYHATKPPTVPMSEADEKRMRAEGYGDEYIAQEYPKAVIVGQNEDGTHVTRTARNAEEEAAILGTPNPGEPAAKSSKRAARTPKESTE